MYYLYKKDNCLGICRQGSGLYEHIIYHLNGNEDIEWTGLYTPFNGEIIGITEAGIKQFKFQQVQGTKLLKSFNRWAKKHLMTEYQINKKIEKFCGQQYMEI